MSAVKFIITPVINAGNNMQVNTLWTLKAALKQVIY